MIRNEVVLVLGAGASKPYDLPLGSELRNQIVVDLSNKDCTEFQRIVKAGFSPEDMAKASQALTEGAFNTIDEFLASYPEHSDLCKAAIAQTILRREHDSPLRLHRTGEHDWYHHLFREMLPEASSDAGQFRNNNLRIITLNYDRSFERFMHMTLCQRYNIPPDEAADIIKFVPVVHLYGQLGYLPWQDGTPKVEYEKNVDHVNIRDIGQCIMTVTEDVDDSDEFRHARRFLSDAQQVYFLGMGYHETEMRRLGVSELKAKRVDGTSLGIPQRRRSEIKRLTNDILDLDQRATNKNILQFLQENVRLSSRD